MDEPSPHEPRQQMPPLWTGMFTLLSLLLAYVALYLLVPELPHTWRVSGTYKPNAISFYVDGNSDVFSKPDYHGIPGQFFAPLYYLDRTYVRKEKWIFCRISS